MNSYDEFTERLILERDIEELCPDCSGTGMKTYSSTAGWAKGVGGQTMTRMVCNRCWGSGDISRPGINRKALHNSLCDDCKDNLRKGCYQ